MASGGCIGKHVVYRMSGFFSFFYSMLFYAGSFLLWGLNKRRGRRCKARCGSVIKRLWFFLDRSEAGRWSRRADEHLTRPPEAAVRESRRYMEMCPVRRKSRDGKSQDVRWAVNHNFISIYWSSSYYNRIEMRDWGETDEKKKGSDKGRELKRVRGGQGCGTGGTAEGKQTWRSCEGWWWWFGVSAITCNQTHGSRRHSCPVLQPLNENEAGALLPSSPCFLSRSVTLSSLLALSLSTFSRSPTISPSSSFYPRYLLLLHFLLSRS